MKRKQITQARNDDFLRCCVEIFRKDYAEGRVRPLASIVERALRVRPRSYYITYDCASAKLHRIEREGFDAVVRGGEARGLWLDLAGEVARVRAANPGISFSMALAHALNFCRPRRFYISPDTAMRILAPYRALSLSCRC